MERQKLLIVDDIPENLEVLYRVLKDDYELFSATSGAEALMTAESLLPDLILLDVMMPGMDGFEVCRILKGKEALQDIPVVFLTALSEDTDELHGFEVGAVDFITKPFKPAVVRQRIATHLALKRQTDLLTRSNAELQEAIEKIKVLSGLLSICATCKKIRDDRGYWNQVETYISQHSDALFSHTYCPDCAEKIMSEWQAQKKSQIHG